MRTERSSARVAIESQAKRSGRRLRLRFTESSAKPELDRIEFQYDRNHLNVFFQRGDDRHPLRWRRTAAALSLCLVEYVIWSLGKGPPCFFFAGNTKGSLAATLVDAIYQSDHDLRNLFVAKSAQGGSTSILLQIFDVDNSSPQESPQRRISFYPKVLPDDCIEIYWNVLGTAPLKRKSDFEELANRIRNYYEPSEPSRFEAKRWHGKNRTGGLDDGAELRPTEVPKLTAKQSAKMEQQTGYKYRHWNAEQAEWNETITYLENRYSVEAFRVNQTRFPISKLWQPAGSIRPDHILGHLDASEPFKSPDPSHNMERAFIKAKFEAGPIKHESLNFRMTTIQKIRDGIILHGALGRYYDNVLTQMALRWELGKAVSKRLSLTSPDALPRRNAQENGSEDPIWNGGNRCATVGTGMLMVFKRKSGYQCLLCRRSPSVGMFPSKFDVVPSAMFECAHGDAKREWSLELNTYRELLEEVYNAEALISPSAVFADHIYGIEPIPQLIEMLNTKEAELSLTSLSVDLTTMIPEITMILVVHREAFLKQPVVFNWEWDRRAQQMEYGKLGLDAGSLEDFLARNQDNLVPAAAVALQTGFEWLKARRIL